MVSIKIQNKELAAFVRISLILSIIILGFSLSCSEKRLTFEEQFNLKRFKVRHFDLYNPILNTYKLDPSKQKKPDRFYRYDVYFNRNDIVRYSFYRADSYGCLQEFFYNNEGKVKEVKIYPILVDTVKTDDIRWNSYYYINGKLKVFIDEINRELVLLNGNSVFLYEGILPSAASSFCIKKINPDEYFIQLIH